MRGRIKPWAAEVKVHTFAAWAERRVQEFKGVCARWTYILRRTASRQEQILAAPFELHGKLKPGRGDKELKYLGARESA